MTQADFIQAVHDELGPETKVSKSVIEDVLKGAGNVWLHALSEGRSAHLFGLGKLAVVERAARKGRNPKTGVVLDIPAKKAAKFTPSKAVKDALN